MKCCFAAKCITCIIKRRTITYVEPQECLLVVAAVLVAIYDLAVAIRWAITHICEGWSARHIFAAINIRVVELTWDEIYGLYYWSGCLKCYISDVIDILNSWRILILCFIVWQFIDLLLSGVSALSPISRRHLAQMVRELAVDDWTTHN